MEQMSEPKITPLARRLAEENGIDWRKLQGTGPEGEITERDILNFLAKVMAGEVTLEGPPPGEPPPPKGEADLEAARAVLEKEGIPLESLIPGKQDEQSTLELTSELEIDLDWTVETAETPILEEPPPEPIRDSLKPGAEEAEPEAVLLSESEPKEEVTAELPVSPLEAPEPPVPQAEEPPSLGEEAEPEPEPVVAKAPAEPSPSEVRLHFRLVPLSALDALTADFSEELGRRLPRAAFLFLAARRALADLEVPLRPLKGRYRVPERENFIGFVAAWEEAGEEGEGLMVEEAEPPIEARPPALLLATEGMPEGTGLLILAGELPTREAKFLERVAYYLEKPIRLLLFG